MNGTGAELILEAGVEIEGNKITSGRGSGVYVSAGTLTMKGGAIHGNSGSDIGSGVLVTGPNSVFNMSGGEIYNNASGQGAGVSLENRAAFTMSGGSIHHNNSSDRGGGVCVRYGPCTFNMTGGEISGNTAKNGGGVYVYSVGTFNMTDGKISGNSADSNPQADGLSNKTGGTIN